MAGGKVYFLLQRITQKRMLCYQGLKNNEDLVWSLSKQAHPSGSIIIKKIFITATLFLVVVTSIVLQHKFDIIYSLVYLENTYLHEEELKTTINLTRIKTPFEKPVYRLDVSSIVHFTKKPSYEVNVFLPKGFSVLTQDKIFYSNQKIPEFTGIRFHANKRKYRNVSGKVSIFIYPENNLPQEKPIITFVSKNGKHLYRNSPYVLRSEKNSIVLIKNENDS